MLSLLCCDTGNNIIFIAENTPLLPLMFRPVEKPDHPAVIMLKALSPIDSDFKQQRIWWKILTIVKVCVFILCVHVWVCMCACMCEWVCLCVCVCNSVCTLLVLVLLLDCVALFTIQAPITILLALTVPLVDDSESDHCWNKWLNVCHCVISPCFIFLITKGVSNHLPCPLSSLYA